MWQCSLFTIFYILFQLCFFFTSLGGEKSLFFLLMAYYLRIIYIYIMYYLDLLYKKQNVIFTCSITTTKN